MKNCTKCNIELIGDLIVPRKRNKSGVDSICRKCYNRRTITNVHKKRPPKNIFTDNPEDYIMKKVLIDDITGCWNWKGYLRASGYAPTDAVKWGKIYKCSLAHRLSYVIFKGEFDRNLFICHTCHNRRCLNPNHLYPGTAEDNVKDMIDAGRAAWQLCNKGRWIKS